MGHFPFSICHFLYLVFRIQCQMIRKGTKEGNSRTDGFIFSPLNSWHYFKADLVGFDHWSIATVKASLNR